MLPWLFVVLVLLNAGLFFWGYQREKSMEPPPAPVPEGRYEIRLIGEVPQDSRQAPHADAPEAPSAEEPVAGGQAAGVGGSTAAEESGPLGGAAAVTTAVELDALSAVDAEQGASEPGQADLQIDDAAAESGEVVESPAVRNGVWTEQATRDEVIEQPDTPDATAIEVDADESDSEASVSFSRAARSFQPGPSSTEAEGAVPGEKAGDIR